MGQTLFPVKKTEIDINKNRISKLEKQLNEDIITTTNPIKIINIDPILLKNINDQIQHPRFQNNMKTYYENQQYR